jgi:tetratricopeptide (TPR) repeat protein
MPLSRRRSLVLGMAALCVLPRVGAAELRPALLAQGEAALARGDAAAALDAFEHAAQMLHAADAEMGTVRAMMQEGSYRRALAFAAHAAGAHRDTPAASALYAWLLAAGGQTAYARRVLDEAQARSPDGILLDETRQALSRPLPLPPPALLSAPQRAAPQPVFLGDEPPTAALQVVASGALVDAGRRALVPMSAVPSPGTALWLRNGWGQAARADIGSAAPDLGIALLRLRTPLDAGSSGVCAASDPFAGSPGSVVAMATSSTGEAAWPWLFQGFMGPAEPGSAVRRRLLFDLPGAAHGAAVFDAAGALAGSALAVPGRAHHWVPMSALRDAFGATLGPSTTGIAGPQRPPADELYERSLRQVVQVLTAA